MIGATMDADGDGWYIVDGDGGIVVGGGDGEHRTINTGEIGFVITSNSKVKNLLKMYIALL